MDFGILCHQSDAIHRQAPGRRCNMANGEVIAYNVASFICALFVLELGADKIIDHTAIFARRTGIPQGVIGLLTAGAEWEEVSEISLGLFSSLKSEKLAVVVVSIARHRSSLAVGNIVGSTISNILGAFSLGLIFHKGNEPIVFDRSSKIYTLLLLSLTLLVAGLSAFVHHDMWKVIGGMVIVLFAVYLFSIAWTIMKGRMTAPERSDSGSDSDSDIGSDVSRGEECDGLLEEAHGPIVTRSSTRDAEVREQQPLQPPKNRELTVFEFSLQALSSTQHDTTQ